MDKKNVLGAYVASLDQKITDLQASLKSIRGDVNDAPSPAQSHSDTTRSQLSRVESGVALRLDYLQKTRAMADSVFSKKLDYPAVGALIAIEDTGLKEKEYYFVVPGQGGGESLSVDGLEILSISISAPIFVAISDLKVGDTFEFRGRRLKLLEIS